MDGSRCFIAWFAIWPAFVDVRPDPATINASAPPAFNAALVAIVGVLAILRGRGQPAAALPAQPEVAGRASRSRSPRIEDSAVGRFVNPVCGIAVDTGAPKHVERFEGTEYYFCCDCCLVTSRKDPAKYAAIHRASLART